MPKTAKSIFSAIAFLSKVSHVRIFLHCMNTVEPLFKGWSAIADIV